MMLKKISDENLARIKGAAQETTVCFCMVACNCAKRNFAAANKKAITNEYTNYKM
jgi:hypothetical protein